MATRCGMPCSEVDGGEKGTEKRVVVKHVRQAARMCAYLACLRLYQTISHLVHVADSVLLRIVRSMYENKALGVLNLPVRAGASPAGVTEIGHGADRHPKGVEEHPGPVLAAYWRSVFCMTMGIAELAPQTLGRDQVHRRSRYVEAP